MRIARIPFEFISIHPTGSKFTVLPPTLDTDEDWLVLVKDLSAATASLRELDTDLFPFSGWESCLHEYNPDVEPGSWEAWRYGDLNLIITDDPTLYVRKVAATLLAQKLNLTRKDDRIALFRAIQNGVDYRGPLP